MIKTLKDVPLALVEASKEEIGPLEDFLEQNSIPRDFAKFFYRDSFLSSVIAQDDDEDYQEAGYVVLVVGDYAALTRYSHCSCYGTYEAICGGGYSTDYLDFGIPIFDWVGSVKELYDMANRKADPTMPERTADPEDYDYDHLESVYGQVLCSIEVLNKVFPLKLR